MSQIRIGISGWTYKPWRKSFYPTGLPQRRELEYASRAVNSIEINGTFYALQKPASYRKWYAETPDDFVFAVKGNRYITHIRRLREVETELANFMASGLLEFGRKLGPILWQLPPSFHYDREVIEAFLKLLPHDTDKAASIAKLHDKTLKNGVTVESDTIHPIRHAMEVRHKSFENEEFISLLRDYDVAMVVADTAGKWPVIEDVTSDFIYVRLHGDEKLYASGYTDAALEKWAKKIRRWAEGGSPRDAKTVGTAMKPRKSGRDVFIYFDNDIKTHAPFDAISLAKLLKVQMTTDPFLQEEKE